jgi:hypothetical protein
MLEGYGHLHVIIRNKDHENERESLMMSYNDLSTKKKGVKTKMKTTINLYGKGKWNVF